MGSREGKVGKATHEKESVGIFDGEKRAENFHPYFVVRWDRPGTVDLEELRAPVWFGSVGAHFDDHFPASAKMT
jgi:hypothetical protein